MRAHIIFHSIGGHTYDLAEAIAEGVRRVPGCEASLYRVPETFDEETLTRLGSESERFDHIPVAQWGDAEPILEADAIILGAPTHFGRMSSQLQDYLDHTAAPPWLNGDLIGKVGAAFTSTASQNGGAEETIRGMQTTLMHFGMVVVPMPNRHDIFEMRQIDVVVGGTQYGASCAVGGGEAMRPVHDYEKNLGRLHGEFIAKVALALELGRKQM
ncbi:MAG: NAD(P)H:quinone oxidoreductase [Clostridia bacterium]|nr:NAD(P)H:quinone oxidoreductase [Clostridia bacterium]